MLVDLEGGDDQAGARRTELHAQNSAAGAQHDARPLAALQDFAEETQEFQQGIDDTRFRRRAQKAPARATAPPPRRPRFPASEVLKLYVACLQAALQARLRRRHGHCRRCCAGGRLGLLVGLVHGFFLFPRAADEHHRAGAAVAGSLVKPGVTGCLCSRKQLHADPSRSPLCVHLGSAPAHCRMTIAALDAVTATVRTCSQDSTLPAGASVDDAGIACGPALERRSTCVSS